MPAPIYRRWAPPIVREHQASESTADREVVHEQPAIASRPSQDNGGNDRSQAGASQVEPPLASNDTPVKRVKKRKLVTPVTEDDQADAPLEKHKALLSKFEKVARKAEALKANKSAGNELKDAESEQPRLLRDLEPLPQPEPVPEAPFQPSFSVLPNWIARPVAVDANTRVPFKDLGVQPYFLEKLATQGFEDALAVQTALLPLLHRGYEQHLGDLCVAAKTGSGKTLAYLLPIIEALKDHAGPVLSAVIIVPTRNLVDQVVDMAQHLCMGTKVRIGTAVGTSTIQVEQALLVNRRALYDPTTARSLHAQAKVQLRSGFVTNKAFLDDLTTMPRDHVPRYDSGVHILVCTPGRLVEHIEHTTGFSLRSLQWLIIDEADQLLDQDFQGWASILMGALHGETPHTPFDTSATLEQTLSPSIDTTIAASFHQSPIKVVLSATMESDLTKLGLLHLRRPKFISVRDEPREPQMTAIDASTFELPATIREYAVPVGEGQKKPLYLLYLLTKYLFPSVSRPSSPVHAGIERSVLKHDSRVLIFTKSNENASRLAHLLSVLEPSLRSILEIMAPANSAKASRKLLKAFNSGTIKILIASDTASRGLDVPDLSHVVNYDMPNSITSYVHRVGRTARAGKAGEAWTLFTKTEAAWFWKQVAKGDNLHRIGPMVKRVEWKEWNVTFDRKQTYDLALAELQEAVHGADNVD